jgi:hypothetical protein
MRIYIDDDSIELLLIRFLRQGGHDVQLPAEKGLAGRSDAIHLAHAIHESRLLLSRNHKDFQELNDLLVVGRGHHPGILVVRRDNDPTRDMSQRGIVNAIARLEASGTPLEDTVHVLNHWR